jgi:fumarate reductase flavoprotein subunit
MARNGVVIIGAGGAGLAAAVEAAGAGKGPVTVLEAADDIGGTTAMSAGVYYGAPTSVQRAVGINDSVERMYQYYMTFNQWVIEPWLARRFCLDSGPTLEWLIELGVPFPASGLAITGVDDVPRGHHPAGRGRGLVDVLHQRASERGATVRTGMRVRRIAVAEGRISGVYTDDGFLSASAVVIAAGGFGANPSMVAQYFPEAQRHGLDRTIFFGSPTSQGDSIALGQEVGAGVVGAGGGLVNWTAGFSVGPADFCPPWLVFVNSNGRRFMDENAPYAVAGDLISRQPGARCVAVFDEAARVGATDDHVRRARLGVGDFSWGATVLAEQLAAGRLHRASSVAELAADAGIAAKALVGTLEAYNADVAHGSDRRFFKKGELAPVVTPPFYWVEILPSSFGITNAGLRIDPEARVYGQDERPIPGLFAAGEAAGGVLGPRYVGGGNSVAAALIFGRIAGGNASQADVD